MSAAVALVVVVIVGTLVLAAISPPTWAPKIWRNWTRPLRRRLFPRRYGDDRWFR